MQLDYKKAKNQCSAAEFAVVEDAKPTRLSKLPLKEVKKKAQQARKYADKAGSDGEKGKLFQEVVQRYEHQLERLEAGAAVNQRKKRRPVAEKAAMLAIPAPPRKARRGGGGKLSAPGHADQAEAAGRGAEFRTDLAGVSNRVKGHVSSRNKRSEAARASRNG